MNVLHILNVADWAFMAGGVGVTLVMMIVGSPIDEEAGKKSKTAKGRAGRSKPSDQTSA